MRSEGKIEPRAKVRHSAGSDLLPHCAKGLRIGVFPTAANPFHWAHLLRGLIAMERSLLERRALEDGRWWGKVCALPFVELRSICDNKLHSSQEYREVEPCERR